MKQKTLILLLNLLVMLTFAPPALAQGPGSGGKFVLGDNYKLESEQTLNGDLIVFGGNVSTAEGSTVVGDMVVFGGNVDIGGAVGGDIAAIGGNIDLEKSAVVGGDIAVLGGQINIDDEAVVKGKVESLNQFDLEYDRHNRDEEEKEETEQVSPAPPSSPDFDFEPHDAYTGFDDAFGWFGRMLGDLIWTITLIITLALIGWLAAAFMPEQMMTVRNTLTESGPLSAGVGLVTAMVATVVGILLLLTICLAFIPIIGWILLTITAIFGWIVIGQIFGGRLLAASGRGDAGFITSTVVGVSVLTLLTKMPVIGYIPCIGWALGFVGALIGMVLTVAGLGAVLLTRFGTRPYPTTPSYAYTGGPSPQPSRPAGSALRWTEPAPDVSEEDRSSSEDELNARIKAALAEADEISKEEPADDEPESGDEPAPEEPDDDPDPDGKPAA